MLETVLWQPDHEDKAMDKGHDVPTYAPVIHLRNGGSLRLPGGLTHDQAQAAGRQEAENMSDVEYVAVQRDSP